MKKIIILLFVLLLAFPALAQRTATGSGTIPGTVPPISDRLLIIGDSLTGGLYATSENKTFARLVADGTDMQLARRGATTLDDAIQIWRAVKMWRPSHVVIEVGLNDVSRKRYDSSWRGRYVALVDDMQSTGATVTIVTTFLPLMTPEHLSYVSYKSLNDDLYEISNNMHTNLADVWMGARGCAECLSSPSVVSPFSPGYQGDNFHPSDAGHALIAEIIIDAMHGTKLYFPIIQKGI